jgi:CubicO group peptidase (beta-lactamase class C family)
MRPRRRVPRRFAVLSLLLVSACSSGGGELTRIAAPPPPGHVPGRSWQRLADPVEAGWSAEGLARAKRLWETNSGTSSVVIVHRGVVVDEWGDPTAKRTVRSIRKSLLSGLLAAPVADGRLRLDVTLAELGVDDRTPLTAEERSATLEHLLSSRSGVYIPAARENSGHRKRRPERGSHPPGSFYYYNNWDFNVLGVVYRDRVAADVGGAFAREIAAPLQMEQYVPSDFEWRPETISPHPAYDFELSARDLARYGLLWARGGRWGERQVIDRSWIELSTRPVTETTWTGAGYGWLWWVQPPGRSELVPEGYFYAEGASFLWVVPSRDLVVVHLNATSPMILRLKLGLLPSEERILETFEAIVKAAPGGSRRPR